MTRQTFIPWIKSSTNSKKTFFISYFHTTLPFSDLFARIYVIIAQEDEEKRKWFYFYNRLMYLIVFVQTVTCSQHVKIIIFFPLWSSDDLVCVCCNKTVRLVRGPCVKSEKSAHEKWRPFSCWSHRAWCASAPR